MRHNVDTEIGSDENKTLWHSGGRLAEPKLTLGQASSTGMPQDQKQSNLLLYKH